MVGEQKESVSGDGSSAISGGVSFADHCLWSQPFDPREGGGVGEAEVIGQKEHKILIICFVLKESGSLFTLVTEVVVVAGLKIAKK